MSVTENEKLYIVVIVFLVIMFAAYIYSDIVMSKKQETWTEADWNKYYNANAVDSNFSDDQQCIGGGCQGE